MKILRKEIVEFHFFFYQKIKSPTTRKEEKSSTYRRKGFPQASTDRTGHTPSWTGPEARNPAHRSRWRLCLLRGFRLRRKWMSGPEHPGSDTRLILKLKKEGLFKLGRRLQVDYSFSLGGFLNE